VTVVGLLELVRGNIPERLQQTPRVVPRDSFERRELDLLHPLPRAAPPDLDSDRLPARPKTIVEVILAYPPDSSGPSP